MKPILVGYFSYEAYFRHRFSFNDSDEDQHLEISREEVIVEECFVQDFVEEAKEDDVLCPMLRKDGNFEHENQINPNLRK